MSRDNSVGLATDSELDGSGSNRAMGNELFYSAPAVGLTQHSCLITTGGAFPQAVKPSRRETEHSPSSSAEVKNGGAVLSLIRTSSWRGP
jgi:hypothetical protein